MKRFIAMAVILASGVVYAGEPKVLKKIDDFDRQEIIQYHGLIVEATRRRDQLIEMAARRHKIDLKTATYDIIAGEFRSKTEDKADGK